MNWKRIAALSLFGLAMGVGTVFFISSDAEHICWPIIFVISAVLIARGTTDRRLLHGIYLGLANCVWVTGAHILWADVYIPRHAAEAAMMAQSIHSPRLTMLLLGPAIGVASGLVIGILVVIAGKVMGSRREAKGA